MRLPLPLRALWRGPVTQTGDRLRRLGTGWTAEQRALRHAWQHDVLAPVDLDVVLQGRPSPALYFPTARNENLLGVARHARPLTPALVRWCVTAGVDPDIRGRDITTRVTALQGNPALTDALARVAQDAIEEALWRNVQVRRIRQVTSSVLTPEYYLDTQPGALHYSEPCIAWLSLQRPGATRAWSPFLREIVHQQVRVGRLLGALSTAAEVPPALLRAAWTAAGDYESADGARLAGRLCARAERPVSVAMCEALLRSLPPAVLMAYFAALPPAFRQACWRAAFHTNATATVEWMAQEGRTDWPGLTAAHLVPLCSDPSAAIRLAAIQLLAQVAPVSPIDEPPPPSADVCASVVTPTRAQAAPPAPAGRH